MKVYLTSIAWLALALAAIQGPALATEPGPLPAAPQPANATPPGKAGAGIRVIVIDPGHGGTDAGVTSTGALEKDLTLAIARKLRATLQSRLGATVQLTRDTDIPLTSEARAAVANNNLADLFISIHVGYSANKGDFGSSLYVIQENFAASLAPEAKNPRLFLPWYLAYRPHRPSSVQFANLLGKELADAIPGWNFPVRSGPVGVLASAAMPSVLLEVGNLNNPGAAQALVDDVFQAKLGTTIASAIGKLSAARQAGK